MKNLFRIFRRSEEGIAYVEFALSVPLLLALFMGAVEVTRYIIIIQKLEKASVTVSDIVAQSSTMSSSQLAQLVEAANQVMAPYTFTNNGYVIISSVTKTGTNPPKVNWQYGGGGTWTQPSHVGVSGGSATWLPISSLDDKENIIIAEVFYNYQPLMVGQVLQGQLIYKISTFKPRFGALNSLS